MAFASPDAVPPSTGRILRSTTITNIHPDSLQHRGRACRLRRRLLGRLFPLSCRPTCPPPLRPGGRTPRTPYLLARPTTRPSGAAFMMSSQLHISPCAQLLIRRHTPPSPMTLSLEPEETGPRPAFTGPNNSLGREGGTRVLQVPYMCNQALACVFTGTGVTGSSFPPPPLAKSCFLEPAATGRRPAFSGPQDNRLGRRRSTCVLRILYA